MLETCRGPVEYRFSGIMRLPQQLRASGLSLRCRAVKIHVKLPHGGGIGTAPESDQSVRRANVSLRLDRPVSRPVQMRNGSIYA